MVGIIVPGTTRCSSPCRLAAAWQRATRHGQDVGIPRTGERGQRRQVLRRRRCAVVLGDAAVGADFARLPFDHLLFTGSTKVGHDIMRMAADNLTPVTLELGGKSPVILGPDYPLQKAAERIMVGKLLNAGQTCIAPDYVLVPAGREQAFVDAARAVVARCFPAMASTPDYTSIVNDRHYQRLQGYVADAEARGARLEPLSTAAADAARRKLPPLALLNVDDSMRDADGDLRAAVPICPTRLDAAIDYVNQHPRPLALYCFESDAGRRDRDSGRSRAASRSMTPSCTSRRRACPSAASASGMGHYHGL